MRLLFGSRTDDQKRGGDVDLLVITEKPVERPAMLAAGLEAQIRRALQGRRVDVLIQAPNLAVQPIHEIARNRGVPL